MTTQRKRSGGRPPTYTTVGVRRNQAATYLADHESSAIDQIAVRRELARSQIVREAILLFLEQQNHETGA